MTVSIIDAYKDALGEHKAIGKFLLFSVPTFIVTYLFVIGNTTLFFLFIPGLFFLYLALLVCGIYNVRNNSNSVLSLNPLDWIVAVIKSLIVLSPYLLVLLPLGFFLAGIKIDLGIPYFKEIFSSIIWFFISSVVLTAFLSFAKSMKIADGFKFDVISKSCIDVIVSLLFTIPQLLFVNLILVGPFVYLYYFIFRIPCTHWTFVYIMSIIVVFNISMISNCFAQIAYDKVQGSNDEYDDKYHLYKGIDEG